MVFARAAGISGWALALLACSAPGDPLVVHEGHDAGAALDAAPATDAGPSGADAAVEPSVEEICGTRTMNPGVPVIDPDDPSYSDARWSLEEVRTAFADARAADDDAYRAYRTAHARPDLMYCGHCTCGCDESIGHESGIDCFKDMHGFG